MNFFGRSLAHNDGTAPAKPVSEEDRKFFFEAMAVRESRCSRAQAAFSCQPYGNCCCALSAPLLAKQARANGSASPHAAWH